MRDFLIYLLFLMMCLLMIGYIASVVMWKKIVAFYYKKTAKIILTDMYQENLAELLPGLFHMGPQQTFENGFRAQTGEILHRPLGSSKRWPHFDQLTFIPAQTTPFPTDKDTAIDVQVTIGPQAKKPMKIDIPLLISGMAYGISISEQVRLAFAKAAKKLNTALNSGEGGILPEELEAAGNYIVQFSKAKWAKDEATLKRANMIELKLGQGALAGIGGIIEANELQGRAREIYGLSENEDAIIHENYFENQTLTDLKELVTYLRTLTDGVPIGAKIGAGGKIEEDIDNLLEIGVDFITIDGAQGASFGAPPIIADDSGIPTLHAIHRASAHLEKRNMKQSVSLLASGGMLIPSHFLKAMALGADAIYVGSAMLFAVAHSQSLQAVPFEPPTQITWYSGKYSEEFDVDEGAKAATNFLNSCIEEIKLAIRAMGKQSLQEVTKADLVSLDYHAAQQLNIPYSGHAWPNEAEVQ